MFGMARTLIVVYKDEMVMNQLRKMIETNDDIDGDEIIGTRDGSINIVAWSEKVWLNNKKAGNIKDKVLFIGDIRGVDKLTPVIDVKLNEFGVKFGWAGSQAILYTDTKVLNDKNKYDEFIGMLSKMPVPDMIKEPMNLIVEDTDILEPAKEKMATLLDKEKTPGFLKKAKGSILKGADIVGKAGIDVASKAENLIKARTIVTRQMLFYGVVKLYNNGLEEFMNE